MTHPRQVIADALALLNRTRAIPWHGAFIEQHTATLDALHDLLTEDDPDLLPPCDRTDVVLYCAHHREPIGTTGGAVADGPHGWCGAMVILCPEHGYEHVVLIA